MKGEPRRNAIVEMAKAYHEKPGVIEFEPMPAISEFGSLNGAWVSAHVWVDFDQTPLTKKPPLRQHSSCSGCHALLRQPVKVGQHHSGLESRCQLGFQVSPNQSPMNPCPKPTDPLILKFCR